MTVTEVAGWHPGRPRRVRPVAYPVPAGADPGLGPTEVAVAGDPGPGRDELVQALISSPLLRVRVRPGAALRGTVARRHPYAPGPGLAVRRREPQSVLVLRSATPARDVRAHVAAGAAVPVLVVSPETAEDEVVRALQAGATSYLVDGQFTATEVLSATLGTAAGRSHLSPSVLAAVVHRLQHPGPAAVPAELAGALSKRERQIMELVAEGHPNAYIARREFIAEKTVRNHLNNIYAKLGVRSRAEAILVWLGRARPAVS